ncbi:MAG: type IV toxin-antitoxin system AbiEi family antitoxin domain-containing protein [Marmoricola sp.]
MDDLFSLHASPVFLRRDALDFGYRDRDLRQAVAEGVIERIRHGAYVDAVAWSRASLDSRHLLLADAVVLSHDASLALSHLSAAVAHGLRMYRPDLSKVHVLCLDENIGRTHSDVIYHHTTPRSLEEMTTVAERLVVPPTRAALEAALSLDVAKGLVVLDSALNLNLTTIDDIKAEYARIEGSRGSRALRVTVALARPGSESVGETLGRYLMWRNHIPEPVLQLEVRDDDGELVARLDWAWPDLGLCGEFDGRDKYMRVVKDGESVADVVMREKAREDRVRELTDLRMIRLVWSDLDRAKQAQTAARIQRAFRYPRALAG